MDKYINKFFEHLQIYEDLHHRRKYKLAIIKAVAKFLDRGDSDSAYSVYEAFFNAYWIGIQGGKNPFLGLTEKIKQYEENAGKLIDYQRDHYVHSVNVFLLGLSIYSENKKYQKYFNDYALNKSIYPDSYDTNDEEFFYRWGLASLFHDIGYPIEITLKQANKYFDLFGVIPRKTVLTGDHLSSSLILINLFGFLSLSRLRNIVRNFIRNTPILSYYQITIVFRYCRNTSPQDWGHQQNR